MLYYWYALLCSASVFGDRGASGSEFGLIDAQMWTMAIDARLL